MSNTNTPVHLGYTKSTMKNKYSKDELIDFLVEDRKVYKELTSCVYDLDRCVKNYAELKEAADAMAAYITLPWWKRIFTSSPLVGMIH